VIDPYEVPPALAASDFSNKVIAAGLLDVLVKSHVAIPTSAEQTARS